MSQLAVNLLQAAGFPGLLYDLSPHTVESFSAQGAVGFGLAVVAGTLAGEQVKTPTVTGAVFKGVSLHTHVYGQGITPSGYRTTETVNVMRKGKVWVSPETAVTDDATAYFNFTTGRFSATAGGNDLVPTGKFRAVPGSTLTANGLVVLEINIP